MNKLGLSSADFTVWKRGEGCMEQGKYIQHLGTEVAPRTFSVTERGYEMELLHPYGGEDGDTTYALTTITALLVKHVWSQKPVEHQVDAFGWIPLLRDWLRIADAESLVPHLSAIYMVRPGVLPGKLCRIHGDPTVANLMRRQDGTPVLVDPIPPIGKVPSRMEVDIGKLLQSALGWERMLRLDQPPAVGSRLADVGQFLSLFSGETRRAAWFWCAVHLVRAVPYCRLRGRHRIAGWCHASADHVVRNELR